MESKGVSVKYAQNQHSRNNHTFIRWTQHPWMIVKEENQKKYQNNQNQKVQV